MISIRSELPDKLRAEILNAVSFSPLVVPGLWNVLQLVGVRSAVACIASSSADPTPIASSSADPTGSPSPATRVPPPTPWEMEPVLDLFVRTALPLFTVLDDAEVRIALQQELVLIIQIFEKQEPVSPAVLIDISAFLNEWAFLVIFLVLCCLIVTFRLLGAQSLTNQWRQRLEGCWPQSLTSTPVIHLFL